MDRSACRPRSAAFRAEADLWAAPSRAHSFRSCTSFDHLGPLARSTPRTSPLSYDAMQGPDRRGPGLRGSPTRADDATAGTRARRLCASRSPTAISLPAASPEARAAHGARCSRCLGQAMKRSSGRKPRVPAPPPSSSPATEAGALHLDRLRHRPARLRSGGSRPADRGRHGAGDGSYEGAEISAAGTARACWRSFKSRRCRCWFRRRPAPRPAARPADLRSRRRRDAVARPISASTPSRSRSSACRWSWCRCRCRRCRSGCRSSPRPGARTSRCASPCAGTEGVAAAPRPQTSGEAPWRIDAAGDRGAKCAKPSDRYEKALAGNDVPALNALFRDDSRTIRYGDGATSLRMCRDQGVPRRALAGGARTHAIEPGDHDLRPRIRRRLHALPASLGAGKIGRERQTWVRFSARLARRCGACEPDRRTEIKFPARPRESGDPYQSLTGFPLAREMSGLFYSIETPLALIGTSHFLISSAVNLPR